MILKIGKWTNHGCQLDHSSSNTYSRQLIQYLLIMCQNQTGTSIPCIANFHTAPIQILSVIIWCIVFFIGVPQLYLIIKFERQTSDIQLTILNMLHIHGLEILLGATFIIFTPKVFLPLFGPYPGWICCGLTLMEQWFHSHSIMVSFFFIIMKYLYTCYFKRVGGLKEDFWFLFCRILGSFLCNLGVLVNFFSNGYYDIWYSLCVEQTMGSFHNIPKIFNGPIRINAWFSLSYIVIVSVITYLIKKTEKHLQKEMVVPFHSGPNQARLPPKKTAPLIAAFGIIMGFAMFTMLSQGLAFAMLFLEEIPPMDNGFEYFVLLAISVCTLVTNVLIPSFLFFSNEKLQKYAVRTIFNARAT